LHIWLPSPRAFGAKGEYLLTMKLKANGHEITLTRDGNRVAAEIDGRRYELEARPGANGAYLLLHEGRVYACQAQGATVTVGGRDYAVTVTDPKRLRSDAGGGLQQSGLLTAQMPGKVVRVLAAEGDEVEEGAAILVVEAMKMQNEMKAARAGTVKKIHVAAGDTVNAGDKLAVIE
jgi:biotin carboxyl carrier protein